MHIGGKQDLIGWARVIIIITYDSLDSFLATPETPLPSPPQGSGQEQYKTAANQASVISHQPLSKQKQL